MSENLSILTVPLEMLPTENLEFFIWKGTMLVLKTTLLIVEKNRNINKFAKHNKTYKKEVLHRLSITTGKNQSYVQWFINPFSLFPPKFIIWEILLSFLIFLKIFYFSQRLYIYVYIFNNVYMYKFCVITYFLCWRDKFMVLFALSLTSYCSITV